MKFPSSASLLLGATLPSLHSALFAPDREPTLKAAIAAEVTALRTLLPHNGSSSR